MDETEAKDKTEVPLLQLKIYDRIPIPDLPVTTSDTADSFYILFLSHPMLFSLQKFISFW